MLYHIKPTAKKNIYDAERYLNLKIKTLFNRLETLYGGTQGLILKASKCDALDLMNSSSIDERLTALQKLLSENPTASQLPNMDSLSLLSKMEQQTAELLVRKEIEESLHQQIQEKVNERYDDYLREIKLQVLKENDFSPENAQTLKKYGRLEKMSAISLNRSALEILRPTCLNEIIGQDKPLKSLISKLNTPYPQHILLYGPPGVGKTSCARLALEIARGRDENPFSASAPFVEVDGTTLRWDPREATNPLLGSVHDPIYQGARRELVDEGIPEPKLGLVSDAHGGILFIDEIGELDLHLQNKLLKVLEDKRVYFDSSYYDPHTENMPRYIKKIFEEGVPADFILIGATTRNPDEISPAFRSRCMEVFFEPLTPEHIKQIVQLSAQKLDISIDPEVGKIISEYTNDGRSANKILVDAYAFALNDPVSSHKPLVAVHHIYEALQGSRITPWISCHAQDAWEIGRILGLGAYGHQGTLMELEAIAFSSEVAGAGQIRFNDTAGSMVKDSLFNAAAVLRKEAKVNIKNYDLHLNFIGGGKVDGPSAGAAIYLAILSAVLNIPLRQDIAITGEISIQGKIKPVGALYEKIHAARQAEIKKILVPKANQQGYLPDFADTKIIPIDCITQAYEHCFPALPNYV